MKARFKLVLAMLAVGLLTVHATPAKALIPRPLRTIQSISVCTTTPMPAGQGDCPSGTYDTHQLVLGPNGLVINQNDVGATTDEHVSIINLDPNCTILITCQFQFYVASGTSLDYDIGTVVLQGHVDLNGNWHLDYAPGLWLLHSEWEL